MPEKKQDILKDEKLKEKARREEAKQREVEYHAQYKKPVKTETITRTIHTPTGEKTKTIERRFYKNGVVKNVLVKVEKDSGMGKSKRIF